MWKNGCIVKRMPSSERIAEFLLDTGAVRLSAHKPFVSKNGKKSPVFCDYPMIRDHADASAFIVDALYGRIRSLHIEPDAVAATAISDSGCAKAVAKKLGLPFVTVHPKGPERVEGDVPPGAQVVLVEDLLFTGGGTSIAIGALREKGAIVTDVVSVLSYALLPLQEKSMEEGFMIHSLTTVPVLRDVAVDQDRIGADESAEILRFLKDPEHWHM